MKKIIFFLTCFTLTFFVSAQNEFDALRFPKSDVLGTARYMGMAGAFSSLGGDPTVMTTNPAGLGLYRSSELTFTANLAVNATTADYNAESDLDRWTRLNVNNFSYVMALPYYTKTQKESSGAIGISFNRQANFHRQFATAKQFIPVDQTVARMINDMSQGIYLDALNGVFSFGNPWYNGEIAWLSVLGFQSGLIYPWSNDPNNADYTTGFWDTGTANSEMVYSERGFVNEWAFTYSHNFNNRFYLGATLGAQNMEYERDSQYSEQYFDTPDDPLGQFYLNNWQFTSGAGFNLKIGGIVRLMDNLRVALAFHTPTWYSITTRSYVWGQADFIDRDTTTDLDDSNLGSAESPEQDVIKYSYKSPYKILAGASYIIAQRGIISFDYELTDYNAMRLHEQNGREGWFTEANDFMGKNLKTAHTFKLGAEYRLTDNFSLRGGLAAVTRTTDKNAVHALYWNDPRTDPEYFVDRGTQYCSLGVGYRNAGFFVDLAYLLRSNKADFYTSYVDLAAQKIRTNTHNIAATIGFRF